MAGMKRLAKEIKALQANPDGVSNKPHTEPAHGRAARQSEHFIRFIVSCPSGAGLDLF